MYVCPRKSLTLTLSSEREDSLSQLALVEISTKICTTNHESSVRKVGMNESSIFRKLALSQALSPETHHLRVLLLQSLQSAPLDPTTPSPRQREAAQSNPTPPSRKSDRESAQQRPEGNKKAKTGSSVQNLNDSRGIVDSQRPH